MPKRIQKVINHGHWGRLGPLVPAGKAWWSQSEREFVLPSSPSVSWKQCHCHSLSLLLHKQSLFWTTPRNAHAIQVEPESGSLRRRSSKLCVDGNSTVPHQSSMLILPLSELHIPVHMPVPSLILLLPLLPNWCRYSSLLDGITLPRVEEFVLQNQKSLFIE